MRFNAWTNVYSFDGRVVPALAVEIDGAVHRMTVTEAKQLHRLLSETMEKAGTSSARAVQRRKMRTTQIIGLTKKAQDFVAKLEELPSDTHTTGMFEEKIALRKWKFATFAVREKLQDSPWSSGPMLFYCLEIDYLNGSKGEILQWIVDPDVAGREVDVEAGAYFV